MKVSSLEELKISLKDSDFMVGEKRILLTGEFFSLEDRYSFVFETEVSYTDFETVNGVEMLLNQQDDLKIIYKNYIVLSGGQIVKHFETVKKLRPEGFISNSSKALDIQMNIEIDQFLEKYSDRLSTPTIKIYNMTGGLTLNESTGSLFDLNDAVFISENEQEVVKRIKISAKILRDMLNDERKANAFFDQIEEEMIDLGCNGYTFERPDAVKNYLRRGDANSYIELRAYGMVKDCK